MDKLQEYYDQLMAACDDGTFPSYAPDEGNSNGCWYRSPDGKRCAVGIRIPDELYDPELEGTSYADLPEPVRKATGLEDVLGEWDVQGIQQCHDFAAVDSKGDVTRFRELFVRRVNELECFKGLRLRNRHEG